MCVNLHALWQGRLAKRPNLYSHSRKHSQQDCLLKNRRTTTVRISRTKLPIGLRAQKSKRHRHLNLESQTPNRITFSKIEETLLSESQKLDSQHDCFLKNRSGTILGISRAISLTGLLVRKPKRHRSMNFESQISLDKACLQSSHATSVFQIPQTTFSKIEETLLSESQESDS
ncbi:hypothetical protein ACFX1X_000348 [Malus domestica]